HAFANFYITEIFANKYNIADDDVTEGLNIDGKDDLGVDCILKKDNTYLIFQFKYKGSKNGVERDEVAGFRELHERLSNSDHVQQYGNEEIRYALEKFHRQSSAVY